MASAWRSTISTRLHLVAGAALALTSLVTPPVVGQAQVSFRVEIAAPVGAAEPIARVGTLGGQWSLAERAALEAMAESLRYHMSPVARTCEMPVAVEIDAESFRGHLVAGTQDGLPPGTRSRFQGMARALAAVCGRGPTELGAVQSRVRVVRYGFRTASDDAIALRGGTVTYATNGDISDRGHLGYAAMIDWLTSAL